MDQYLELKRTLGRTDIDPPSPIGISLYIRNH